MNCALCKENLAAYVERLLDQPTADQMEWHLSTCAACRAELETVRRLGDRLASSAGTAAEVSLEPLVMDEIIRRQALELRRLKMRRRFQIAGLGGTTAAAIAFLLLLGWWSSQREGVLEAAEGAWFNLLHLHGSDVMFDLLADYPVQVVNWHDRETPPTLAEALTRFPGAVCGGLRQWETMARADPETVVAEAKDAIEQTGGKRFILGTGCVTPAVAPTSSATMATLVAYPTLIFQAVRIAGTMLGKMSFVNSCIRLGRNDSSISFRSLGIALMPSCSSRV